MSPEEDRTRDTVDSEPKHYQLSYSAPHRGVNRLVGLMVKASSTREEDPGVDSLLRRAEFSGSSHTSDLNIRTPVVVVAC